ncbi:MAG: hypothetical protein MJZ41_16085 [Bacteroidaceae bacterium]|nr:hypothetical protein [Bacteroidaceae bacterium]
MKKTIITLSALCISVFCSAQLKTTSAYDVDGNGAVNISDVSSTVEKVLGRTADNRQVVDAATLNSVLQSIDTRLAAIEAKLGIDTHEYVDLDLPSGTLWATMNVGAESPEDYGNYYAWGETKAYGEQDTSNAYNYSYNGNSSYKKTAYYWSTYKWCDGYTYEGPFTKYNTDSSRGTVDNKKVLELADDAAYVNWGENWRMPTKAEQDELRDNCTWTWTSINGKNGYKVSSKKDSSKYIFLPAAGHRRDSSLYLDGSRGYYWSSSLDESDPVRAYELYFDSSRVDWSHTHRCFGFPVRPVRRQ